MFAKALMSVPGRHLQGGTPARPDAWKQGSGADPAGCVLQAAAFVQASPANVAATITPQHILWNRNALFQARPSSGQSLHRGYRAHLLPCRGSHVGKCEGQDLCAHCRVITPYGDICWTLCTANALPTPLCRCLQSR